MWSVVGTITGSRKGFGTIFWDVGQCSLFSKAKQSFMVMHHFKRFVYTAKPSEILIYFMRRKTSKLFWFGTDRPAYNKTESRVVLWKRIDSEP